MGQTSVERTRLIAALLMSLIVLNVVDAASTIVNVAAGATEVNPIMAFLLLEMGVSWFLAVKLTLMPLACLFIWGHREHPRALIVSVMMFGMYSFIVGVHAGTAACLATVP